jgi:hypothetical protein
MNREPAILASLAGLVLLAAAALAAIPLGRPALKPAGAMCAVAPGDLEALLAQAEAENRGHQLAGELARLRQALGEARAACPLPDPPRIAAPPAPPAAPPAPPPVAALPADRWDRRDLGMLEGCWNRETAMQTTDRQTGRINRVVRWVTCFDRNGVGRQQVTYENGMTCSGPVRAEFLPNGRLAINDTAPCGGGIGGVQIPPVQYNCRRIDDSLAICDFFQPQGGARGGDVRLRR